MKKILLIASMLIISSVVYSQTDAVVVNSSGNVGIGCDPGTIPFKIYRPGTNHTGLEIWSDVSRLLIYGVTTGWDFAPESQPGDFVFRTGDLGVADHHGMIFHMPNNDNDGRSYIKFGDDHNGLWFGIFNNRKVRIDGEVFAKKITVKTNVWADDVFDADYQLMTLPEIESYINAHKHLPDVPCAEEVIEEGINVSEMNALLLRKVEELTLHLIEQNKVISELKTEVENLKK